MARLLEAAAALRDALRDVPLDVPYVYHPLDYAWVPHATYLSRYGVRKRRVVLVGMNPGPWGMAQTGVPFADPAWARDWMGISADVPAPPGTHPARPVLGYASLRRDPSGANLYGYAQQRYGTAEAFFARFFVTNLCPLMFLDEAGRNLPMAGLRRAEEAMVLAACEAWIASALDAMEPAEVVALGNYVHERLDALRKDGRIRAPLRLVRHPSPASPANNAGWGAELDGIG